MKILTIIQSAEQLGCELVAEEEDIYVKNGKVLPDSLKVSMKDYKKDILTTLTRDKKAKAAGLIIGIPGVMYTVTISNLSSVYIEFVNGNWDAWRETYYKREKKSIGTKTIVTGKTFDYVLLKVQQYLDYIIRKQKA